MIQCFVRDLLKSVIICSLSAGIYQRELKWVRQVTFLRISIQQCCTMIGSHNGKDQNKHPIPKRAKKRKSQDFIVSSCVPRKPFFTRLFLNTTWISKRCSIISVEKCLALCVPTYLPIQNISHAYTVSICTAWNNGIRRAMAAKPSDVRNVKPLAEYLKVAISKTFQLVFIWMAWLMCSQSKNAEKPK